MKTLGRVRITTHTYQGTVSVTHEVDIGVSDDRMVFAPATNAFFTDVMRQAIDTGGFVLITPVYNTDDGRRSK